MPRKSQEKKLAIQAKKARIIDLFNADGDWCRFATQLNITKTTAYRWIKEGNKDNGRGGSYNVKITNEHRDACVISLKIIPESRWLKLFPNYS